MIEFAVCYWLSIAIVELCAFAIYKISRNVFVSHDLYYNENAMLFLVLIVSMIVSMPIILLEILIRYVNELLS